MNIQTNEEYHKHIISKVSEYIEKNRRSLPSKTDKRNSLERVNEFIRTEKSDERLPMLYRYSSCSIQELENLESENVYLSPASRMNDYLEGAVSNTSKNSAAMRKNEMYLKCFSINPLSVLMWSHYADCHKGICVGYNFNLASDEILEHLYPIQYSDTRYFSAHPDTLKNNRYFFIRKSTEWDYEKEWRLIYKNKELPHSGSSTTPRELLHLDIIKEVTFGLGTSETSKKIIMDTLCGRGIRFFQIKVDDESYKLIGEEI